MEQICNGCGNPIQAGRLKALPGTKVCVDCSTAGRKKAVTITGGDGEDTFNDIVIVNDREYQEIVKDDVRKNTLD
jgi:RNA polymerase-binding transcription factor DksA